MEPSICRISSDVPEILCPTQVFSIQVFAATIAGQTHRHGFGLLVAVQQPKSRGTIRLKSGNPFHYPLIDPNYFQEDVDVEHLLSGEANYIFLNEACFFQNAFGHFFDVILG